MRMEALRPGITSGRCGSGVGGFLSSVWWAVRNSGLPIMVLQRIRELIWHYLFLQVSPNKSSQIYSNHPGAECSAKVRATPVVSWKECWAGVRSLSSGLDSARVVTYFASLCPGCLFFSRRDICLVLIQLVRGIIWELMWKLYSAFKYPFKGWLQFSLLVCSKKKHFCSQPNFLELRNSLNKHHVAKDACSLIIDYCLVTEILGHVLVDSAEGCSTRDSRRTGRASSSRKWWIQFVWGRSCRGS